MRNSASLGPRLHLPIHSWRPYRDRSSQFITRHRSSRHILRSRPLPLCPVYRSCLCHCRSLRTLIPSLYRLYPTLNLNKNPLWSNVCRCKPNLLPPALPRTSRHASPILRLSRCLHPMKYYLLNWIPNLTSCSNHVLIYHLRSIYCKTRSLISRTNIHKY